ncbi:MAG: kynureninase [Flavobacteriales bacterium]
MMEYTLECARKLDAEDPLASFRSQFHIPKHEGKPSIYFTGNSLGAMPKKATEAIQTELNDWAELGVEGHFKAKNPWMPYHEFFQKDLAKLVGAKESEVLPMNSLTTNLHLLMVSFYQPTAKRFKIICEENAFPSDQYALESQVKFHGYDPEEALIELKARPGEFTLRTEDILEAIETHKEEAALLMIGGVNYYTGQVFDMKTITAFAKARGLFVGWDLAHGAGNIDLELHDWDVDFAAWCSYKYLNAGPGSISSIFIHEKHHKNPDLPRFTGWWGYRKADRFEMKKGFVPIESAEAWQLSNVPVLAMAAYKCSLEIVHQAGFQNMRTKSKKLTQFMDVVLESIETKHKSSIFELITPKNEAERGCQFSLFIHGYDKTFFDALTDQGVISDWREPNVIRIAPVPLYNSFEDIFRFGQALEHVIKTLN